MDHYLSNPEIPMGLGMALAQNVSAMERFAAMSEQEQQQIGMPVSVSELGILLTEEQCRQLAYHCSFEGTRSIGGFRTLNQSDMEQIYKSAR